MINNVTDIAHYSWKKFFETKGLTILINSRKMELEVRIGKESTRVSLLDQFRLLSSLKKHLDSKVSDYKGFESDHSVRIDEGVIRLPREKQKKS